MKNKPLFEIEEIHDLKHMLQLSVENFNQKNAFLVKEPDGSYRGITYRQFSNDIEALGTYLLKRFGSDVRVAVMGQNCYEWSVAYLAAVNGLGLVVPIDKELPAEEILSLLQRSEAQVLVYADRYSDKVEKIKSSLHDTSMFINMHAKSEHGLYLYDLIQEGREIIEQGNLTYSALEIATDEMKILLFTSGTTAVSKGVMLSHGNICENLMAMCSMTYIGRDDIFLSVLPLHHTYECTCGFLCPIYRGATIAHCQGLKHIQENMQETGTTVMLGVPLLFEGMYKKILEKAEKVKGMKRKLKIALGISGFLGKFRIDVRKSLFKQIHEAFGGKIRMLVCGAAAIDPAVSKGFRELGILLIQGYGLTEASPIVALNRNIYFKDEAAGLPLPNLEVKISAPDEEGVGEILAKGPSIMLGYYEDKKSTEEALFNGWLHTGDLGYLDEDGFLKITGRKKNVIITKNGKNVYPEEIEAKLLKNKYISEVIVKEDPGVSDDTVISALIYPDIDKVIEDFKAGMIEDPDVNDIMRGVIKEYNQDAVMYKKIKKYVVRQEEFEKTTTKKIKRHLID